MEKELSKVLLPYLTRKQVDDLVSYLCMDDDYAKRQDKMQKRAESVGLGGANKVANLAIEAGGTSKLLKNLGLKYIK